MGQITNFPKGRKDSSIKGLYGKKRGGKVNHNGGFSKEPRSGMSDIDPDEFDRVFPNSFKPSWMKNAKED